MVTLAQVSLSFTPRSAPLIVPAFPVKPLAGAFGLGHKTVVEQSAQHTPDDRPQDVEPHASEVPSHQHRPEGASGVDGPPGHWSRYEHPNRQGKPHRYGSYRGRSPLVGGHRHHHKDQDEGDEDL